MGEAWREGEEYVKRAAMLQDFVHRLEPSRKVTLAAQNNHKEAFAGVTDVIGYNYLEARAISDHKKFPASLFRRSFLTIAVPRAICEAIRRSIHGV